MTRIIVENKAWQSLCAGPGLLPQSSGEQRRLGEGGSKEGNGVVVVVVVVEGGIGVIREREKERERV